MRMPPARSLLVALTFVVLTSSLGAQTAQTLTPMRWGAEGTVAGGGGAALLRFLSPRTALVLGFSASYARQHQTDPFGSATQETWFLSPSLGVRKYSSDSLGLRGIWGGGVVAQWGHASDARLADGGLYAELGAEYGFTQHFSAGALGNMSALHSRESIPGNTSTATDWHANLSLVRVMATVRF